MGTQSDEDRRLLDALYTTPEQGTNQAPKDGLETFDLLDTAAAIPRGVGNALGNVYDLVDFVAFDALPDTPEGKLFGESKSIIGGVVESAAQFATGFIPGFKFLAAGGKVAGGFRVARGLSTVAERALSIAGKSSKLLVAARTVVAGVIADATVFGAHEQRLSNLIQAQPGLKNVVTEFLAASPDDSEVEGRLKNALEGIGLGFAIDGLAKGVKAVFPGSGTFAGLKGIQAHRIAKAAGDGEEAAARKGLKAYQTELEKGADFTDSEALDIGVALSETSRQTVERLGITKESVVKGLDNAKALLEVGDDLKVNPRTLERTDPLSAFHQGLLGDEVDLSRFPTNDGAALVRGLEGVFEDGFNSFSKNENVTMAFLPESLSELDRRALQTAADYQATDPVTLLARLSADIEQGVGAANKQRARIHAAVSARDLAAKRLKDLGDKVIGGSAGVREEAEFLELTAEIGRLSIADKAAGSVAGRNLRARRQPAFAESTQVLREFVDKAGGSAKTRQVAQRIREVLDESGTLGITKLARESAPTGKIEAIQDYWINALLSGPKTHIVNITSNAFVAMYRPTEKILGGALGAAFGGGKAAKDTLDAGLHEVTGLLKAFSESFKLARVSLTDDKNLLEAGFRKVEAGGLVQESAETLAKLTGKERLLKFASTAMHSPTTLLSSADEFFKQLNFRSSLYAELHIKAVDESIAPDQIAEYITKQFDNYIDQGQAISKSGAYSRAADRAREAGLERNSEEFIDFVRKDVSDSYDSGIAQRAIDNARENTFTEELPIGTFGRGYSNLSNAHPFLRFFTPFVRTPLNILKFAGRRLDAPGAVAAIKALNTGKVPPKLLASHRRIVQDILSSDPRKKFEALGKISMGFGTMTYFMSQATSGKVTGKGPSDPNHRKLLQATGWQPYSVLVGDKYYSYQRVEPVATIMGIAADLVTYGQYADTDGQGDGELVMGSVLAALSNNIAQKSYLTGIQNVVGALDDPERNGAKYIQNSLASFVPNLLNQIEDAADPNLHEVRSMMDALYNKTPGLSSSLPAVRNMLGEKSVKGRAILSDTIGDVANFFLPIQYSTVSSEVIETELRSLGKAFSPPSSIQGGVDLRDLKTPEGQGLYDKFQELTGTIKIGGSTLRAALTRLMKSSAYLRLDPTGIDGEDSQRVKEINKILRRYRSASISQLRRDLPELQAATQAKRRARLGISSSLVQ